MKRVAMILCTTAAVLLVLTLSGVAGMMGLTGMMGHFGGYGGMMNGFGLPGAILMFAGWPLIVTLLIGAVWLARYVGPVSRDSESPLDILKKRYAKGEITKEEFDAIKKDLAA